MTQQELAVLAQMQLFEGIPMQRLEKLLEKLRPQVARMQRGEVIWPMGERVSRAGIVLSGRVEAWHYSAGGQASLAAVHTAGGLFGDVLMSARTVESPVELRVAQSGKLLFLPLSALLAGCADGTDEACVQLLSNLLAEISNKYWVLQRRVRCLEIPDGKTRLCVWLLQAAQDAKSQTLHLSMTREQLAGSLGMNRCALSRLLGNMQKSGLIACRRGEIELLDRAAMLQIAENA